MNWYLVLLFFMMGTAIGSFVNVLISRSIEGINWISGRSYCDNCKTKLEWYVMIPLFSYLLLGGKSHCCKKKLSLAHPLVELMFGALFVWWLVVGFLFFRLASAPGIILQPIFWLGIAILLLIIGVGDALYGVIIMPIIYLAIFWIYGYRILLVLTGTYQLSDLLLSLGVGLCSYLFLWILHVATKGRGMGDGDPYLAFVTGSLLGVSGGLWGMLLAFILGSIWGIGLMIKGSKKLNSTLSFGPFLIVAAFISLLIIRF